MQRTGGRNPEQRDSDTRTRSHTRPRKIAVRAERGQFHYQIHTPSLSPPSIVTKSVPSNYRLPPITCQCCLGGGICDRVSRNRERKPTGRESRSGLIATSAHLRLACMVVSLHSPSLRAITSVYSPKPCAKIAIEPGTEYEVVRYLM